MKKIIVGILFFTFAASPAFAAEKSKPSSPQSRFSLGAGYGFDYGGVFSIHGDYDISSMTNNAPVKVRVGYDHYSEKFSVFGGNYSWSYNVFYGGAYYDFSKPLQLDPKIHPFAGLGLGFGSASCSGNWCGNVSSPTVGGFYYILGVQYDFTHQVAGELNFNGWGGLSLGANFKF